VVQAITHALFDLASNPEYLKPLREEVEEVTTREGWTKAGVDQMHKVDSFVKESQRLHPVAIRKLVRLDKQLPQFYFTFEVSLERYAIVDHTFSDGTSVPAGTVVTVPSSSIHLDPDTYEDPLRFEGFRFIKMKERAARAGDPDKRFDMVTTNAEFVAFGQGRHACPGRFFAAAEIKLLLAHIVTTYDVKLADGDDRPPDFVQMNSNTPNPSAKVYFRRRQ
jgi:cytochrome P450